MLRQTIGLALLTTIALSSAPTATAATGSGATTTHQRGYVMACTGERGPLDAFVELYTNSTVTVPTSVVIRGPHGVAVAADDSMAPRIRHGRVKANVALVDRDTDAAFGKAKVRGTYQRVGEVIPISTSFEDDGALIEERGTNRQLRTDLRVRVGKVTIPLTCDPAFAYDLNVTRTPLG